MAQPRYLTKSRFKLALECPTKLFYTRKPEYADNKQEDDFLAALAEGGFQVGALAQCMYPGGVEVSDLDYGKALNITGDAMKQERVVLFEAAIQWHHFFIRVDILEKKDHMLRLIEVKSIGFEDDENWITNKGTLNKKIAPYLYDVAFQAYVTQKAFPDHTVQPFLMMLDKNAATTVEGLHQKFLIKEEDGRNRVIVNDEIPLGGPILQEVDVAEYCDMIINGKEAIGGFEYTFQDFVDKLGGAYAGDLKLEDGLGRKCKSCEFTCSEEQETIGLLSGFRECWQSMAGLKASDFRKPMTFEVWNYRRSDAMIGAGKYFMEQLEADDLKNTNARENTEPGLSGLDRQILQVNYAKGVEKAPYYFDKPGFAGAISSFKYPLHFIDFETLRPAIPFHRGMRPYMQLSFQFSHHIFHEDGSYAHFDEYINADPGAFPNFDFVRALKQSLDQDDGTIFRYAAHENSVLVDLYHQLSGSGELDKHELMDWIKTITKSGARDAPEHWEGDRNMEDMLELVKKYFYHPAMGGSNSIKDVLPAVLNASERLREKYIQPVYGTEQIPSLNYRDTVWIHHDVDGKVVNPYKLLPPIHQNRNRDDLDLLFENEYIPDGGAAMIAWSKTQYTEMSGQEREEITDALLKYCELDTLAMVMIWEFWMGEMGRLK